MRSLREVLLTPPGLARAVAVAEGVFHRALLAQDARSRWVQTSVGPVHAYDIRGQGPLPPVVLLHGASAGAMYYGPLVRLLRPHVQRIVAPDGPGHGLTPPPPRLTPETFDAGLCEALDHLLDTPATVFGTSLGGAMALRYGALRPERVSNLVVLSPAGAPLTDAEREALRVRFEVPTLGDATAFLRDVLDRPPWFAPLVALELRRRFRAPHLQAFFASLGPEHALTADALAHLVPPVHLIWGLREVLLPASGLRFFEGHLPPGTTVEQPPHFAHAAFLEHPRDVADRILAAARRAASAPLHRSAPAVARGA